MLDQKRITLDRVKIAAFMSEETLAFTARVLFDGKPIASARNAGHGGCTDILAITARTDLEPAEVFCKSLPDDEYEFSGQTVKLAWNLERVVDQLANDYEFNKKIRGAFNRMLRNYVAYESGGAIYQIKRRKDYGAANIAAIERSILAKRPDAVILHTVPIDTAFAIYCRICVKE